MNDILDERDEINLALESFFPRKITEEWLEINLGKASWKYDVEAVQKGIVDPIWNFLDRGGKRWRPFLMMLCCEAVGGKRERMLKFCAIPEFIHNGTLIIDDIEDNSDIRRGKPSLHKIFGLDTAINAGNAMYYFPFLLVSRSELDEHIKKEMYEVIFLESLRCHIGQGTDIYWHNGKGTDISESEYLQMCANKTGVLARMAAKLGAILGSANDRQIEFLGKFGETLGVVFQINDDIANIIDSESLGKQAGDDIHEGKRTLPVLYVLKTGSIAEKKRLIEILDMHTEDASLIAEARGIIQMSGAIEYSRKRAHELMKDSWNELENLLEDSPAKEKLRQLAQMLTG